MQAKIGKSHICFPSGLCNNYTFNSFINKPINIMLLRMKDALNRYALVFLFQFVALAAMAQNKTVSGKVTDASTGSPLVGATVSAKGASKTVVTDASGSFTIDVPSTVTQLTISYAGYASMDFNISGSSIDAKLSLSNATLGDIVIIGYGSARKKTLPVPLQQLVQKIL